MPVQSIVVIGNSNSNGLVNSNANGLVTSNSNGLVKLNANGLVSLNGSGLVKSNGTLGKLILVQNAKNQLFLVKTVPKSVAPVPNNENSSQPKNNNNSVLDQPKKLVGHQNYLRVHDFAKQTGPDSARALPTDPSTDTVTSQSPMSPPSTSPLTMSPSSTSATTSGPNNANNPQQVCNGTSSKSLIDVVENMTEFNNLEKSSYHENDTEVILLSSDDEEEDCNEGADQRIATTISTDTDNEENQDVVPPQTEDNLTNVNGQGAEEEEKTSDLPPSQVVINLDSSDEEEEQEQDTENAIDSENEEQVLVASSQVVIDIESSDDEDLPDETNQSGFDQDISEELKETYLVKGSSCDMFAHPTDSRKVICTSKRQDGIDIESSDDEDLPDETNQSGFDQDISEELKETYLVKGSSCDMFAHPTDSRKVICTFKRQDGSYSTRIEYLDLHSQLQQEIEQHEHDQDESDGDQHYDLLVRQPSYMDPFALPELEHAIKKNPFRVKTFDSGENKKPKISSTVHPERRNNNRLNKKRKIASFDPPLTRLETPEPGAAFTALISTTDFPVMSSKSYDDPYKHLLEEQTVFINRSLEIDGLSTIYGITNGVLQGKEENMEPSARIELPKNKKAKIDLLSRREFKRFRYEV